MRTGRPRTLCPTLTWVERLHLTTVVHDTAAPQALRRRAQVLLLLTTGVPLRTAAAQVGLSRQGVYPWLHRFAAEGLAGLPRRPPMGGRPRRPPGRRTAIQLALSPADQAQLETWTRATVHVSHRLQRRARAVLLIAAHQTITETAARIGVTRQQVYRWLWRYQAAGLESLRDQRPRHKGKKNDFSEEYLVGKERLNSARCNNRHFSP